MKILENNNFKLSKRTIKKVKTKYPIIGHGKQGTVFKLSNNEVLKVYNRFGRRINKTDDLEVAKRLEKCNLKCFIKPYSLKVRNGLLYSYKMKKIEFDETSIGDLTIKKYLECLKEIRNDTKIITDAGVQINDLEEHNIGISKGKIIIYDISDYFIGNNKFLENHNRNAINDCFGCFCLKRFSRDNPIYLYDRVYSLFLKSKHENIEDFFEETIEDKDITLKEYIKSLEK